MDIKKVAVLGAGAVGSYVIWGLSNNKNITLGVVADGERNERLKNQGLMINGTKYTPQVWTPEEAHNVDLLIVSLKYGSLKVLFWCKKQPMKVENYLLKRVEVYRIRKEIFEGGYLKPGEQYLQLRYLPGEVK